MTGKTKTWPLNSLQCLQFRNFYLQDGRGTGKMFRVDTTVSFCFDSNITSIVLGVMYMLDLCKLNHQIAPLTNIYVEHKEIT